MVIVAAITFDVSADRPVLIGQRGNLVGFFSEAFPGRCSGLWKPSRWQRQSAQSVAGSRIPGPGHPGGRELKTQITSFRAPALLTATGSGFPLPPCLAASCSRAMSSISQGSDGDRAVEKTAHPPSHGRGEASRPFPIRPWTRVPPASPAGSGIRGRGRSLPFFSAMIAKPSSTGTLSTRIFCDKGETDQHGEKNRLRDSWPSFPIGRVPVFDHFGGLQLPRNTFNETVSEGEEVVVDAFLEFQAPGSGLYRRLEIAGGGASAESQLVK